MEIKTYSPKEEEYLGKSLIRMIRKIFVNKKSGIVFAVTIIAFVFILGNLSGLLLTGFFGSLDNPSSEGLTFLRGFGISNTGIREVIKGIMSENIFIPWNYIKGQFSDREKLTIDIGFEEYEKLRYKQDQAIKTGFLLSNDEDFVPAKIRYDNKEIRVNIRLKGDEIEHLSGDTWSFRVKLRDDETLEGMRTFSLQKPRTRNYLHEYIFHKALAREGIIALRYDFVEVSINGKNKGIYAIEEHFDKELIEYNERREGVIVKFNEDIWYQDLIERGENSPNANIKRKGFTEVFPTNAGNISYNEEDWKETDYFNDPIFYSSFIDIFKPNQVSQDPLKMQQFEEANALLNSFRQGKLSTHEVFDVEQMAKYFALVSLLGSEHAAEWNNIRFYYNPVTMKLEPIGFDGNSGSPNYNLINNYFPECIEDLGDNCSINNPNYYDLLFKDKIFFERYIEELEKLSEQEYLDNLFIEVGEELEAKKMVIHKSEPYYSFSKEVYYQNQQRIEEIIKPINGIRSNFEGQDRAGGIVVLSVGNLHFAPIMIDYLEYQNQSFFPNERIILQPRRSQGNIEMKVSTFNMPNSFIWKEEMQRDISLHYHVIGSTKGSSSPVLMNSALNLDSARNSIFDPETKNGLEFVDINEQLKQITILNGEWDLDKNLYIPEGYTFYIESGTTVNLINRAVIISSSPVNFIGEKENPIVITSTDGTGGGIVILQAKEQSYLKNVIFSHLQFPKKERWELTGSITFYESPVDLDNVHFIDLKAEDGLNIIRSQFTIKDSLFEKSYSDCVDVDFSDGVVENVKLLNCGNDALDFSGSNSNISSVIIQKQGDKGISAGEKSKIIASNANIDGGYICIASKDNSELLIKDSYLSNCKYGFTAYQKKPEFGAGVIKTVKVKTSKINNVKFIEKKSSFMIDNNLYMGDKENVYDTLYDENDQIRRD